MNLEFEMQENIPLEEVFDNLKCTREGLSSEKVQERLDLFGYNKLEEKKVKSQTSMLFSFLFPFQIVAQFSHEMLLYILFNA